ncbi:hexokinase [Clostridia bacterium]|nr:hexokinase [Clostridia bacterium]
MGNLAFNLGLVATDGKMMNYIEDFEEEMLRGLEGKDSSLLMLPTYISQEQLRFHESDAKADNITGKSGQAAVIDAGGTNLRIALVELGKGSPNIKYYEKYPIPGFREKVSKEEFFSRLSAYLEPIIGESDKIGFCFSNPAEVLPNRDAKIITFTKEVVVTGSEGALLGESLKAALRERGLPWEKNVVVLNDTVATQLSAMADSKRRGRYSGYIGLILGTGINASYSERNEFIKKSEYLRTKPGTTIINTEAGGYGGFPQNEVDSRFIAATCDPDYHKFEKMASGAYQYNLLLEWIRYAVAEKQFSEGFSMALNSLESIPIGDADRFYFSPGQDALSGLCKNDSDREGLKQLIEAFFDRVGFMTAAVLTGMIKRMGDGGKNPERPVCISAEGTTFYNARLLRPGLERYMEKYTRGELGYHYDFVRIEDATILGSAVAGLAGE